MTASDDGTAVVWDATTGLPVLPPLLHGPAVNQARFSPDGRSILTVSSDGTGRLWDANDGQRLACEIRHQGPDRMCGI